MIKIRFHIILSICLLIFCIGLTGCIGNNTDIKLDQTSEETSKDSVDTIDYDQYLKKIWVEKNWDGGAYDYSFSFFISNIENGVVEGKLSTHAVAEPDFFYYSLEPSKYLGDLNGMIDNSIAECEFSSRAGDKGKLTLIFKNDEIEATIDYTEQREVYKDISLAGKYLFRPYNLADIEYFTQNQEHSFAVDLDSWGNVYFVSGEVDSDRVIHPAAFLTNEHDDILYVFNASFHTGSRIIDAEVKDINGDSLKDIKIITAFFDYDTGLIIPDMPRIEWIFYQMENGLFYSD